MSYSHRYHDGTPLDLPTGKVLCVGRNYVDHARELGNPVPESPLVFLKPSTAVVSFEEGIVLPGRGGECHFETEIAVLIGVTLKDAAADQVLAAVVGFGIGLDLTLRTLQKALKEKSHPWELAKAFDASCPLTDFVSCEKLAYPKNPIGFGLTINGEARQKGCSNEMIFPIEPLISFMSQSFTLLPGDVVLTGTPAGVGPLQEGDELVALLGKDFKTSARAVKQG
jgi:2-keto-4-pentenoate hydratase/2-oxohepta-3-ene-1,7-dioic acid hydratase in catechol pathway